MSHFRSESTFSFRLQLETHYRDRIDQRFDFPCKCSGFGCNVQVCLHILFRDLHQFLLWELTIQGTDVIVCTLLLKWSISLCFNMHL